MASSTADVTPTADATTTVAVCYIINEDAIRLGQRVSPPALTKSMTFGCCHPAVWTGVRRRRVLRRTKPVNAVGTRWQSDVTPGQASDKISFSAHFCRLLSVSAEIITFATSATVALTCLYSL